MAAFNDSALFMILPVEYGRSGYNGKPENDDDETKDKGRSGYNKGDKEDEQEE